MYFESDVQNSTDFKVQLSASRVTGNDAVYAGGGVYVGGLIGLASSCQLRGIVIANNTAGM